MTEASHTHTQDTHTNLQKRRLCEHAEELWEVVSDLFIHSTHQADLAHGASAVGSLGVRPLHLQEGRERAQIRRLLPPLARLLDFTSGKNLLIGRGDRARRKE